MGLSGIQRPCFSDENGPLPSVLLDKVIQNAVEAESEEGRIMLANKRDLIWLKRTRDSKQDQADIEKLEDDKDR